MTSTAPSITRRACLAALLATLPVTHALADSAWPSKPIRLIVPAPAGGASDMIARTIAESLRQDLKQTVIVENKPGAGGIIAVETMLGSRDGYTFVLSPNSLVTEGPHSYKFRFDPFKDLAPVAEVASVPLVLVADPKLPVKNVADMVTYVKARPGKISYASYSPGTLSHIKGMQFNKAAGLDMEHVGYKGSPPALTDVMGGQIQFMFDGMGTALPLFKTGKVRALAVTSPERSPFMPDVPTLAEAGYPNLSQIMGTTVWSTPDIPADVRNRLQQELLKAVASASVKSQLAALGMDAGKPKQSMNELADFLKRENERTGQALRAMNYQP
ncbi:tripartite tricarboxylate transporter substrate binding protein [Diaphorobacter sp. HDW4A]|uniref:tripartite tricarboxylate transporter substrate binding protein n=1 Tax=Diaphorobacter sp. HDW4A TaxID=2714924 RepID=UPI00140AC605|nr:tripartite tricarboxylate transporter substrate binding protein [Diaphorobacter sp. HDW4A]QIL79698.1 tripartite tricarboxylate transporter substrate binding protein [Diaphorobacter sp. HDW4A]